MSERANNSGDVGDDAAPVIRLTIINVHPSHVADARLHLRRETEIAEAAGAKIIVKVQFDHFDKCSKNSDEMPRRSGAKGGFFIRTKSMNKQELIRR